MPSMKLCKSQTTGCTYTKRWNAPFWPADDDTDSRRIDELTRSTDIFRQLRLSQLSFFDDSLSMFGLGDLIGKVSDA